MWYISMKRFGNGTKFQIEIASELNTNEKLRNL